MVFASLEFLLLFLPLFFGVYTLVPVKYRNGTLLAFSWLFYAWWSVHFLFLFIAITCWTWVIAIFIEKINNKTFRKFILVGVVFLNASVLFWFKYINIIIEAISNFLIWRGSLPVEWEAVVLPIGLSFIILQAISYVIDVYKREVPAQKSFWNFATYLAMFTQLVAGPIIRYDWVLKELTNRPYDWENFIIGARRFMIGLSMKVIIADSLAPIVDMSFSLTNPSFMDAWIGAISYTFQLFFDFAGYSAMAIGLGRMLGFYFPENFNHPYLAIGIQDFWRRWHISLSTWIRDYLYIPLGGSRLGTARTYFNLLITMAIAGMWHGGDSWNFLIWGLMHGVALSVSRCWRSTAMPVLPSLLSRILTLLFVVLAWVIFRAAGFDSALVMYEGLLGLHGWSLGNEMSLVLRSSDILVFLIAILATTSPYWIKATFFTLASARFLVLTWPLVGFLTSVILLSSRKIVPFLYFQF